MAFQSSANSNRFGALSNNQNTSSPFAQMSSGGTSPVQIVVGDELEDTETEVGSSIVLPNQVACNSANKSENWTGCSRGRDTGQTVSRYIR